jgi:uncharacterized protein YjbI with pentapeptide repeats
MSAEELAEEIIANPRNRRTLTGADLAGANLEGANLHWADLRGANLAGANLAGANIAGAKLRQANLTEADLAGANLYLADLTEANLEGTNLTGALLAGAKLRGAFLYDANLRGANLSSTTLRDADLTGADLTGADLRGADLRGAVFQGGLTPTLRLDGADLRCADLGEVSAELLERVAPGAKLDGARTQLVRPTATCLVKVSYRGSPNGGRITWMGDQIKGPRPSAKVGARPFPDDDCTSFGSRYARWAGIVLGSPRPLGLGETRVGYATPAKIAALVEGQLTFERLACHLALRVPGSGGFRSAPRFSMSDVLRFVSDSIIETMERLGEKPGPVDEDRDFL